MKFFSLMLPLFLFTLFVTAQEKVVEIPLNGKNPSLMDICYLPEKGILLKTGSWTYYTKDSNWKIHLFDEDLNKRWDVPIKREGNNNFGNHLVASSKSDYIYHIETKKVTNHNSIWQISQIHDGKIINTFEDEIDDKYEFNAFFIADNNLNVFAREGYPRNHTYTQ